MNVRLLASCDLMAFVATTDAGRARQFYADVLGLRLVADEPFALVFDAHGTSLRVARVDTLAPAAHTVLGWVVPDLPAAVTALAKRGVIFELYPGLDQDERGICTFPGAGRVAWFKDPDGNTLSLTERDSAEP
jgi:catechol 2,3-dioxygenase-like lactoylglutathione lyase family enzyme